MPTPLRRKVWMLEKGVRQAEIARALRLSAGHVCQVINGTRRDARVEAEVARRLAMPVEDVFAPVPRDEAALSA